MKVTRREFIKQGGILGGGLAMSASITSSLIASACSPSKATLDKFALQLYTLRDVLPNDAKGTLEKVASFGYKQLESYEGPSGIFWGMSNKEFKSLMDNLGMSLVSSHCEINKDFERTAAEAGEIGVKYLVCPWIGMQESIDDFKRIADDFNAKGEICKKNGLRFGYHNHDYSFQQLEGQLPQAVMMDNTDPDLVDYELDLYWVVTAGDNPEEWLKKYNNRFRLCHVKDRQKNTDEPEATCTLGTGGINYASILATAKATGMQYYIVEQEHYVGTTPLDCAKDNADFMTNLAF